MYAHTRRTRRILPHEEFRRSEARGEGANLSEGEAED